jgi:hypothetical protein
MPGQLDIDFNVGMPVEAEACAPAGGGNHG